MPSWSTRVVNGISREFSPLLNEEKAAGAAAYMKHIAPFLGISAPERRRAVKAAIASVPLPTSEQLGKTCMDLMRRNEREYHYASFDLIQFYIQSTDEYFLAEYVEPLILQKPWWDTVDGFVTAGVSPLCWRYDATEIVLEWSDSQNIWLIRAALGHQRGWKNNTDIPFVLSLCSQHWSNREFFIAKAIGWSLRDLSRINPLAVQQFLREHPGHNPVARREAERGLSRSLLLPK